MSADKRIDERIPILGELQGEIMVFQPMLLKEISRGGLTVESRTLLHLNSLHELRLTLGERSVVVKARVVHSRITDVDQDIVTYRTGMEFADISDRIRTAIVDFIDTLKANRRGV